MLRQGKCAVWAALLVCCCLIALGQASQSSEVVERSEEITFWEREVAQLRDSELREAIDEVDRTSTRLQNVKKNSGFFPDQKTRATLKSLDEDYQRSLKALATVRKQEEAMLAKLKPLYGVLSLQFAQEQKDQMASSITYVKDSAFNSALFDTVTSIGEAESFSDLIGNFVASWVGSFLLLYPLAVLFYAFWSLPWSIYAYSSGALSVFAALPAYVVSLLVFSSPLIVLAIGMVLVVKKNMASAKMREGLRHRD